MIKDALWPSLNTKYLCCNKFETKQPIRLFHTKTEVCMAVSLLGIARQKCHNIIGGEASF